MIKFSGIPEGSLVFSLLRNTSIINWQQTKLHSSREEWDMWTSDSSNTTWLNMKFHSFMISSCVGYWDEKPCFRAQKQLLYNSDAMCWNCSLPILIPLIAWLRINIFSRIFICTYDSMGLIFWQTFAWLRVPCTTISNNMSNSLAGDCCRSANRRFAGCLHIQMSVRNFW